jgi:hypothetical protein
MRAIRPGQGLCVEHLSGSENPEIKCRNSLSVAGADQGGSVLSGLACNTMSQARARDGWGAPFPGVAGTGRGTADPTSSGPGRQRRGVN